MRRPSSRGSIVQTILVALAVLVGVFGGLSLSQATMGAGLMAAACLLGILARMVQASHHQSELHALLLRRDSPI